MTRERFLHLLGSGQTDEAIAELSKLIERDPDDRLLVAQRADLFLRLGNWKGAALVSMKAAIEDRAGTATRQVWDRAHLALAAYRNRSENEALEHLAELTKSPCILSTHACALLPCRCIELLWDQTQMIGAVRLVTCQSGGTRVRELRSPVLCYNIMTRQVIVTFQRGAPKKMMSSIETSNFRRSPSDRLR